MQNEQNKYSTLSNKSNVTFVNFCEKIAPLRAYLIHTFYWFFKKSCTVTFIWSMLFILFSRMANSPVPQLESPFIVSQYQSISIPVITSQHCLPSTVSTLLRNVRYLLLSLRLFDPCLLLFFTTYRAPWRLFDPCFLLIFWNQSHHDGYSIHAVYSIV